MYDEFNLTLDFEQSKQIYRILRKYNNDLPSELLAIRQKIQVFLYETMTIDEAEVFFNEE